MQFGRFKEKDIEWIVLEKKEENGQKLALLLSKYVIAAEPFQRDGSNTDWSNSSIRKWLNGNFYIKAFSSNKDEIIQKHKVVAYKHDLCFSFQGIDTEDRIFLLSAKEVENEKFQNYRLCSCLENLKSKCCEKNSHCRWILRTIAKENKKVVCIDYDGKIDYNGCAVNVIEGIRPAMWVDLGKM